MGWPKKRLMTRQINVDAVLTLKAPAPVTCPLQPDAEHCGGLTAERHQHVQWGVVLGADRQRGVPIGTDTGDPEVSVVVGEH